MCEHKWKTIATINYASPVYMCDDGNYGYFLQDKIQECQECFTRRAITRQCCVTADEEKRINRTPDWINMVEGDYTDFKHGDFFGFMTDSLMYKRYLDYPDITPFNRFLKPDYPTNVKTTLFETGDE
jgi:hypothetical protein